MKFAPRAAIARHRWRAVRRPLPWLMLATAIVLTIALRLPFLSLPMISDEGGYAYAASRWLSGRGELYRDLWISRPQGIFVAYAAIFSTLGTDAVALRIGALLVTLATLLVVWRFAALIAGRRVAGIAALLFALLSASPAIEGFTANAEVFMALPAALCALLLLLAARSDWRWWQLASAGAMASLAMQLKPSAAPLVAMAAIFVWALHPGRPRRALAVLAWFGGGLVLALVPAIVHGIVTGWGAFVFASLTYRMQYQSSPANGGIHHLSQILLLLQKTWPVLLVPIAPLLFRWWHSGSGLPSEAWTGRWAEATRLGIVPPFVRVPGSRRIDQARLLLRLWLIASIAGIAMGGDWWTHYLIQILAPLAIWIAIELSRLEREVPRPTVRMMFATLAVLLALPFSVIAQGDAAAVSRAVFHQDGYTLQEPVAAWLREHTDPEDRIYAAFNAPALYYLADRASAYPYLYNQELRAMPESEAQLIAMVTSPGRPAYVIGTKKGAPFADRGRAFWAAVSEHYHLAAVVHGVPIFRANSTTPMPLLSI